MRAARRALLAVVVLGFLWAAGTVDNDPSLPGVVFVAIFAAFVGLLLDRELGDRG